MSKNIFVNLPVEDLQRSMDFFRSIGFGFNMQFTDENAACLVIGDNIYAMLLTQKRFRDFTKKPVSDARKQTEVLIAIDVNSRNEVDDMIKKAVLAGGKIYMDPQDHGWMYGHSFEDPDGHQWEVLFMDTAALEEQQQQHQSA